MNASDAAYEVLAKAGAPVHVKDLTARMVAQGLWTTRGKTPWDTLSAILGTEVNHLGVASRFARRGANLRPPASQRPNSGDLRNCGVALEHPGLGPNAQPIDVATRLEGAVAPCLHAVDPAKSAEFDPVGYELDQSIEHARQAVKDAIPRAGWMRIGNSTSDIVATPDAAEPSRYVGPEPGG